MAKITANVWKIVQPCYSAIIHWSLTKIVFFNRYCIDKGTVCSKKRNGSELKQS